VPPGNSYAVTAVSPRGVSKLQKMATRYSFSLAHAGCDHSGTIVLEERGEASTARDAGPVVMSLPRGFVNLNAEAGAIEIVCVGCRQTVAAAARADIAGVAPSAGHSAPGQAEPSQDEPRQTEPGRAQSGQAKSGQVDPGREAKPVDAAASGPAVRAKASNSPAPGGQHVARQNAGATRAKAAIPKPVGPIQAADAIAPPDRGSGRASADPASDDKLQADIEALFAEAENVAPIRGDAIPSHLLDRLRHLADRMRQRRE